VAAFLLLAAIAGAGVLVMRGKKAAYREQGAQAWERFERWSKAGFPADSLDALRSVRDLDALLFELERAGMTNEQTAVALGYDKLRGLILARQKETA
jgi:hypothetical protein